MAAKPLPDQKRLNQLLRYEPETGRLFWRVRPIELFNPGPWAETTCAAWNSRWAGKGALDYLEPRGRFIGTLDGRNGTLAHRVIWCMIYGYWPNHIDHIDGDPTNNRIENLRDTTSGENAKNKRLLPRNTSGCHGVSRSMCGKKWRVNIGVGTYNTLEEAIAARRRAEQLLGYHPNHGRKSA